jgi:hypothetical protein
MEPCETHTKATFQYINVVAEQPSIIMESFNQCASYEEDLFSSQLDFFCTISEEPDNLLQVPRQRFMTTPPPLPIIDSILSSIELEMDETSEEQVKCDPLQFSVTPKALEYV